LVIFPHNFSGRRGGSAVELVVALSHQDLAGLPFVACRPVPGGQLLIRLRSIAGGAITQQVQPIPGRDPLGHTGVGQPIHRKPPVRIGRVLQARRIEDQRPTHPRTRQIDRHIIIITAAGDGQPVAEVHALADLQAVSVQGGTGVVAQARPLTEEAAADADADQADRTSLAGADEPAAEKHTLADLQAVSVQGGTGVVAQARPLT
jgi:hypothetical protein